MQKNLSETKCSYKNCLSHECRQKTVCYESLYQFALIIVLYYCLSNNFNRIHEQSLRIVYGDNKSNFEELLRKDKS